MNKKRAPDIDAVMRDYRMGKWTNRELGDRHGVAHTTIKRWAEKYHWAKDLTEAVRHATNAAVIAEVVAKRAEAKAGEVVDAVLVAAEISKQVVMRHRQDILDVRGVAMEMLHEIRLGTHSQEELEKLLAMATAEMAAEDAQALQQSLRDMLKLHNRVGSLHKLADVLNKLQPLERKAFNMDEAGEGGGGDGGGKSLTDAERAVRLAKILSGTAGA